MDKETEAPTVVDNEKVEKARQKLLLVHQHYQLQVYC